jgi:hypothetical protein
MGCRVVAVASGKRRNSAPVPGSGNVVSGLAGTRRLAQSAPCSSESRDRCRRRGIESIGGGSVTQGPQKPVMEDLMTYDQASKFCGARQVQTKLENEERRGQRLGKPREPERREPGTRHSRGSPCRGATRVRPGRARTTPGMQTVRRSEGEHRASRDVGELSGRSAGTQS